MAEATNPEVDLLIQKGHEAIGTFLKEDFHSGRIIVMVEKNDLFANQRDRGFVETTVEGDGSVFGHDSQSALAKEIFQMRRRWPQTFQVGRESLQGSLTSYRMKTLMISLFNPSPKG